MKINLIIFLSSFGIGGAGNSIFRLCKGLSKKKFNISIICLKNCPLIGNLRKLELKYTKLALIKVFLQ